MFVHISWTTNFCVHDIFTNCVCAPIRCVYVAGCKYNNKSIHTSYCWHWIYSDTQREVICWYWCLRNPQISFEEIDVGTALDNGIDNFQNRLDDCCGLFAPVIWKLTTSWFLFGDGRIFLKMVAQFGNVPSYNKHVFVLSSRKTV